MDPKLKQQEHKWGRRLLKIATIPYKRGAKAATVQLDHEYELLHSKNAKSLKERYLDHPGKTPRYSLYRIDAGLLRERQAEFNALKRDIAATPVARAAALSAVSQLETTDPDTITPVSPAKQARLIRGLYLQKIDEQQTKIDLLLAAKENRQGDLDTASQKLYGEVTKEAFDAALAEVARFVALKNYRSSELPPKQLPEFTRALTAAYEALEDLGFSEQAIFVPPMQKTKGARFLSPEEQFEILLRVKHYINDELAQKLPCAFELEVEHEPSRDTFSITYHSEDGLLNGALLKIGDKRRRLTAEGRGYSLEGAIEHELNTHLLRTTNGIANELAILEFMPHHGFTEEGLAIYNTDRVAGILDMPPGLRAPKKALPVVLMGARHMRPHTFKDLFNLATTILYPARLLTNPPEKALASAQKTAYGMVYRAKRGTSGGFSVYGKDLLYYDGVKRVEDTIKQHGDNVPKFLYAGKVDIRHEGFLKAVGLDTPPIGTRFDLPEINKLAKEAGVEV